MILALLTVLTGILVLLYMARPRYEKRTVSSARFFGDLPESKQARFKIRLANPLLRRPFYLQLLALLLAILAIWIASFHWSRSQSISQVLLVIDTSASMGTLLGSGNRFDSAKARVTDLVDVVRDAADLNVAPQFALAAFDLEVRQLATPTNGVTFNSALSDLEPRSLGTDLAALRGFLEAQRSQYSHLLVVSDQPPPAWAESGELPVIWQSVGEPAFNVGFESIRALRDPLSGVVERVQFTVRSHGEPKATQVTVIDDQGQVVFERAANFRDGRFRAQFVPAQNLESATYRFELSEGGDYRLDDGAEIVVTTRPDLNVAFQIDAPQLQTMFGQSAEGEPRVHVTNAWQLDSRIPQLLVGPGFQTGSGEIRDFVEHQALRDLNLDVAERLVPLSFELPAEFAPLLRTQSGAIWAAVANDPPSLYIAGLPQLDNSDEGKFTTTLFFNSLRWLLEQSPATPLYRLTSPSELERKPGVTALHLGEGDTQQTVAASPLPQLEDIAATAQQDVPIWPPFFFIVALIISAERILAVWGGRAWR